MFIVFEVTNKSDNAVNQIKDEQESVQCAVIWTESDAFLYAVFVEWSFVSELSFLMRNKFVYDNCILDSYNI